jgi:hypothetical protein
MLLYLHMAKSDEQKDETSYTPEPGSSLHEMKKIEDMERAEEAAGVYEEEDRRRKLEKQEDEWYADSEFEDRERDEKRGKVLEYRLDHGQISERYKWMLPQRFEGPWELFKDGYTMDFERHFDDLLREAMKGETWSDKDYQSYMRWNHHRDDAEVALMRDIFPGFSVYLESELRKVRETPIQEPDEMMRHAYEEARDSNAVKDAIRKFMDGEDLEKGK